MRHLLLVALLMASIAVTAAPSRFESLAGYERYHKAVTLMQQGRFGAAKGVLAQWKGSRSLRPFVRYNLGVALLATGHLPEGRELLGELAATKSADDPVTRALLDHTRLALGKHYLAHDLPVKARQYFAAVQASADEAPTALFGEGWSAYVQGHYAEAVLPWQSLLDAYPHSEEGRQTWLLLADALQRAGYPGRAAAAYERALQEMEGSAPASSPTRLRALFSLAQAHDQLALRAQQVGP